jgi:hypothetical protein
MDEDLFNRAIEVLTKAANESEPPVWRMLEPNEPVEPGDEFFNRATNLWEPSQNWKSKTLKRGHNSQYRRRVKPHAELPF